MLRISATFLSALVLMLFQGASLSFAQEVHAKYVRPKPSKEIMSKWRQNIFQTDEVFVFENKLERETFLKDPRLGKELQAEMLKQAQVRFPNLATRDQAKSFYPIDDYVYYFLMPVELKKKLPQEFLRDAYVYQAARNNHKLAYILETEQDAIELLSAITKSKESFLYTLQYRLFHTQGKYFFFLNPDTWSHLRDSTKETIIREITLNNPINHGYNVTLLIDHRHDLAAIAQEFATGEQAKTLEETLKIRLEQSRGKLEIPLVELLHPFVKKTVNTYSVCSGPNCLNTMLNATGIETRVKHDWYDHIDIREMYKSYRFVRSGEKLRPGDMLIYQDAALEPVHYAVYAGYGFVFTKNGMHQSQAYVMQKRDVNEKGYFADGVFRLLVLRKPLPGEQTAIRDLEDARYLKEYKAPYYYEHPSIQIRGKNCGDRYNTP